MNNSTIRPDENRIEELLAKIQPIPSDQFHQKMKQAIWRVDDPYIAKGVRLKWAIAILALAALTTLFVTPQGRAWAQEVFQFFTKINSTTVQLPEDEVKLMQQGLDNEYDLPLVPVFIPTVSPEMAKLPGCETPQSSQSYHCQIALAESQLGFDLAELPTKPEDWKFETVSYDLFAKRAAIRYSFDATYTSTSMLDIYQGAGSLPTFYRDSPWAAVPADKVETVKIGSYSGEYVQGSFTLPTGSTELVWDGSDFHQRLAWSDGSHWILLELWPNLNLPNTMGRDQLIELAESLINTPSEQREILNPEALYSISDAEELSGLNLKAPTILPIETDFSHARYDADNDQVSLFYGINNELVIYEWKGKSFELDKLTKIENPNYEVIEVNRDKAYYAAVDGPDERLFLWWKDDELFYQMYYYRYLGGQLNQEKMVAIAESMQDIDDFRSKNNRSYERVSIFELAMEIDAKEFASTPEGWSFENVWANPGSGCIALDYSSLTEPAWLLTNQCKTDRFFNTSDIPFQEIQSVLIGHHLGKYVAGSFTTDSNGQMTWDPESPVKRLYWKQDGIWIEMTIGGEGAALYEKKDLISYAESLR